MRIVIVVLLCGVVSAQDIPYGFAPGAPLKFKRAVRDAVAARPASERWIEQKRPVEYEQGGNVVAFQWVEGGFVSPGIPGGAGFGLSPVKAQIDRGFQVVSWVFQASHVIVNYNRYAKSSPQIMREDLDAMMSVAIK